MDNKPMAPVDLCVQIYDRRKIVVLKKMWVNPQMKEQGKIMFRYADLTDLEWRAIAIYVDDQGRVNDFRYIGGTGFKMWYNHYKEILELYQTALKAHEENPDENPPAIMQNGVLDNIEHINDVIQTARNICLLDKKADEAPEEQDVYDVADSLAYLLDVDIDAVINQVIPELRGIASFRPIIVA